MQIRVSEIPDEGLRLLDAAALGAVYADPTWTLDAVSLLVERRGQTIAVTGDFEATVRQACGRCLEPLVTRITPGVDLQLVPQPSGRQGEMELGRDDLEMDFYQGDVLDAAGLLRSETDLALPMKPLCRPDCRGLCPVCGGNRNVTECRCETRGPDPRLAPLEALKRLT
ncbi:MAG: YceD family protein [Candidatus Rokuibacteriota bacterium]